jgi:hypothetical protein
MLLKLLQALPLVEVLVLIPLAMYGIGKLLKIQSPMFKFKNCVWMMFVAGLLAGFAAEVHLLLGVAVFLALMSFMVRKQFKATAVQIVVLLVAVLVISLGLEYLRAELTKMVLLDKFDGIEDEVADDVLTEGEYGYLFSKYSEFEQRKIYMEFSLAQEYVMDVCSDDKCTMGYIGLNTFFIDKLKEKYGLSYNDYSSLIMESLNNNWGPERDENGRFVYEGYIDDYDAFIQELESYEDNEEVEEDEVGEVEEPVKKGPSVKPVE